MSNETEEFSDEDVESDLIHEVHVGIELVAAFDDYDTALACLPIIARLSKDVAYTYKLAGVESRNPIPKGCWIEGNGRAGELSRIKVICRP